MTLTERIENRIRAIPASNPGFISVGSRTLGDLLADDLLRTIAKEAAAEAVIPSQERGAKS